MIVSFDLDDTLFVSETEFEVEPALRFPLNLLFRERLRAGTIELMQYIRDEGIALWIYTTSFRSEFYIKGLFRSYGIRIDRVINGKVHAEEVQADHAESMPSKYPSKYRIDLHVDDDVSVAQNGSVYGFNVFLIGGPDSEWVSKMKKEINRIRKRNET